MESKRTSDIVRRIQKCGATDYANVAPLYQSVLAKEEEAQAKFLSSTFRLVPREPSSLMWAKSG